MLIVGSTGFLGARFAHLLKTKGHPFTGTSSRPDADGEVMHLDLSLFDGRVVDANGFAKAIIFAGITNYERCRDENTRDVNVVNTVRLIATLLEAGVHVTFISSNSVFGQAAGPRDEASPTRPDIPYADQKAEAECLALEFAQAEGYDERFSIIRLTKVLSSGVAPFREWIALMGEKKEIVAATDFVFAPISWQFAAESVYEILSRDAFGIFHLSGEKDISYYEFAKLLCRRLDCPEHTVSGKTMAEMGLRSQYVPVRSMLDMSRTTQLLSLTPQPVSDVVAHMIP